MFGPKRNQCSKCRSDYNKELKKRSKDYDVRSKEEFEGGHVKGALNIPLDTLSSNFKKIGDKDTYIITCCMSGGRSTMAKDILHKAGYDNVHNGGGWHSLQSKLQ
jgi:rhodanese-related sulfurtransferase